MNSMDSSSYGSNGSSLTTPLTTPGSRGMQTRTAMAGSYTPSGLKNSSVFLTPRAYLRPQILRFGSLPMIDTDPDLKSQTEARRPRPLLALQPRRTTFSGMRPKLPSLDVPQSRGGLSAHPTSNYTDPTDTPRFGLALISALYIAIDDLEREAIYKQEANEMEQSSYWSASETEADADEASGYNVELLESYHSCL